MKSTNSILSSTGKEMKYQSYTYILWITLFLAVAISFLNLYGLMTKATSSYDLYVRTYNVYKDDGMDVEKMLSQPVNVKQDGNVQTIDNPVRYQLDQAVKAVALLKNSSILTQTLEWMSFVFFPLIFALYSISIAAYDYKFQTIKTKAVQYKWNRLITAKWLSASFSVVIIYAGTLILSYVAGYLFYNRVIHSIAEGDLSKFDHIVGNGNLIEQILFSLGVSLLFSSMGFFLGILFKSTLIPVIIFFIYDLMVPILGKYDVRNLVSVIAHEIFDFEGRFQLFKPTPVAFSTSLILLSLLFVMIVSLSFLCFAKQSKYTV